MNVEIKEVGEDKIKVVTWDSIKKALTPEEHKTFLKWMQGQTCMEEGVFSWDWKRWVNQGKRSEQLEFDWD